MKSAGWILALVILMVLLITLLFFPEVTKRKSISSDVSTPVKELPESPPQKLNESIEEPMSTTSPTPVPSRETSPSKEEESQLHHKRRFPNTTIGIFVFDDQLSGDMSEGQLRFAATHYVGSQKLIRSLTRKLRKYNPDFIVLHYRLGIGLGYRRVMGDCEPRGEYIMIVEGDRWVREWPDKVEESWFYHIDGKRVLNCKWGWYLVDLDDESWRTYWSSEVLRQLEQNENDGLFVDSYSVPNYLGFYYFNPQLPEIDAEFEAEWAAKLESFTEFMKDVLGDKYYWIPNVGAWITLRDPTDYSLADGIMIEGFSMWCEGAYFHPVDWKLQMNRALSLSKMGKIVIAQTYVNGGIDARLFALGSYLLIKGERTYINLELSMLPEWFPEYEIPMGYPLDPLPDAIDQLFVEEWGVYVRRYSAGLVLVNPFPEERLIDLNGTYYLACPHGGGVIPVDGEIPSAWGIEYLKVQQVKIPSHGAAILLYEPQA